MEKKSALFLILTAIILIILLLAAVQADELTQVKKSYNWLQGKTLGKWANLDTKQHVFSLLALQYKLTQGQIDSSVRALLQKSQNNGTCWPSTSCTAVETAIAKMALDALGKDSTKATEWLLNKSIIPPLNLDWYLQIVQPEATETSCLLVYDNAEYEVSIDEHDKLSGSLGNCFSISYNYWLNLQPTCTDKIFNISCDQGIKANFLFKKGNEWYVTSQTIDIAPLGVGSLNLTTRCIASGMSSTTCDYEATLWTAYAFALGGEEAIAKSFVPYLVMEATNNKQFLPEAFLFKITGKDSYADYISTLQDAQGFIVPQGPGPGGSAYNKYYDTALAKISGSSYKTNETKTRAKLFSEQKQQGDWGCEASGCDSTHIRETAMILLAFWPSYQWLSECEQQGAACVDNCSAIGGTTINYECFEGECCNISYDCEMKYGICKASCSATLNETQVPYACSSGVCCKNYTISLCITEINGSICSPNQECVRQGTIVPFIHSSDSGYCCLGTCQTTQQTCSEQGGVACNPNQGYSCQNEKWLQATDEPLCCQAAYCIQGAQTCGQQGGTICMSDETCKDGQLITASDTNGQATCCVYGGICIKETCNYEKCEEDESCVGASYETSDALVCCEGNCLKSCSAMNGVPCNASMSCKGSLRQASDVARCCIGKCEKKGAFPWWIIIVIVILAVVGALFWLIKTGKIKLKGKPKAAMPRIEYGFPPVTRPTALPPRGLPPRAMPAPAQRPVQRPLKPQPTQKPLMQKPIQRPVQQQAKPVQPQRPAQPSQAQQVIKKKLPSPPKPSA
ncbi:MAG: hypothetical protein ACPLXC_02210 [Candidatus Pacearchaeota archaeon]